ncbi:MAG: hypothetical protein ACOC6R_01520 [Chloroflexota bacterium]
MIAKMKKIEALSEDYKRRTSVETIAYKKAGSWEKVRQDWWYALIFYFDRAFYQGRSDSLSGNFERATVTALDEVLGGVSSHEKLSSLKRLSHWVQPDQWKTQENPLWVALNEKYQIDGKEVGTGRERDKEMVLDSLRFVLNDCKDCNILEHSTHQIENQNMAPLSKRLDDITSVGVKITSFFLRDTVFFYDLEACVRAEDYPYLMTIDRWVSKVTNKLGIKANAETIATTCLQNGISPVRFAIGLWYVGSHSFDVLLDML